jgi:hypothetical protein
MPSAQAAHKSEATISAISFISCVPTVASGKAERCGTLKQNRIIHRNFCIIMKRETINKIANFFLTVITAFVSTFLMQSCM